MKGLNTLIKLHKRNLDELRRQLVTMENQKQQLLSAIENLKKELLAEQKLAATQVEMAAFFGDFAKRIQKRQDNIHQEIHQLDKTMDTLREGINLEFGELKKYEIALANAKKRKIAAENRKEMMMFDEIAIQQDGRKKNEEA